MNFRIKPEMLSGAFMLPTEITDKHIKLAGALQLKVILYCYRHMAEGINTEKISEALSVSKEDTIDALCFWCELGLLEREEEIKVSSALEIQRTVTPHKAIKPSRAEVARRGLESPEIAFLLGEAQVKFGRTLKQSESSVLVWLYDDLGLDAAVILMVIEYAAQAGKCNVGYIEKVGKDWVESGVDSIMAAEKKIVELGNAKLAWNTMRSAFGLDMRAPSENETKMANTVVGQWKMSKELLKKAYDACIDQIGKYRASYINTILTTWHKNGIKTLEDLKKSEKHIGDKNKESKNKMATYDLSKLNDIINGD